MIFSKARRLASALLAALVLAILIPAGPALAARSPGADSVVLPLTIVGFDPAVAAANGYPTSPPVFVSPAATDTKTGNCGFSSVSINDVGVRKYTVNTGFGVPYAAISYSWAVNVVGPNWNVTHKWGGGLAFRNTWEGTVTNVVSTGGWYTATASGTAVLSNGWVCRSAGPSARETIY